MTKHHPHDYLPATRHDALLPCYDPLARLLGLNRVYKRLVAQAEVTAGHRVLEIGCGTGNLTILLKREQPSAEVIGCDPDPRVLRRAQRKARRLPGIRFEQAYAQRLPYADAEFDRVLSSMMLHHIYSEAKPAAVAEIHRVLRPGGSLHLVDIHGDGIPELLRAAGFDCTEISTYPHRVLGRLVFYRATR